MTERSEVLTEPWSGGISVLFRLDRVVVRARTAYQEVVIAETEAYGRALFIDGLVQSTESDEALYHEPFIHPGMIVHGRPRRVLLGGIGEGACLREILRHASVEEVLAVDIDREIVAICREHLPDWSAGAFEDPGVGQFGTAPRTIGVSRYQFRKNVDLVVTKDTRFGRQSLQVRLELLNLTNTAKFNGSSAGNSVDLDSFGRITSQRGFMRIWQFSFRYAF